MSRRSSLILAVVLLTVSSVALAIIWIYQVDPAICNGCGICIPHCSTGALRMEGPNAIIVPELCNGCGDCVPWCIRGAIYEYWYNGIEETEEASSVTAGPFPASNTLLITGASQGDRISIYDTSGRAVLAEQASGTGSDEIDLSSLSCGSYLLRVGEDLLEPFSLVR